MKEKQKQLLSEMMQEDEKSGLYDEALEEAALNNCVCKTKDCVHFKSFLNGVKWQKEQFTVEEQHVGHTISELNKSYIKGFNEGALWQQKQMYSEEDLYTAFKAGQKYGEDNSCMAEINLAPNYKEWFKQFKKK